MPKILAAFLLCAAAQGTSLNVTLSVNATVSGPVGGNYSASGPVTLTGGIADSGTFTATIPVSAVSGTTVTAPYSMTFSQGTMAGTISIPAALLLGMAASGSGTVTVATGTGSYSGDTASFPVSGSGSMTASGTITLSFSGSGTITAGSAPTITAVLDAGSYTANLAPGSVFVVKGSNLSASSFTELTAPYPASIGQTSVTFAPIPVVPPGTTQAFLIYTYNQNGVNQVAGVVPSTLPVGNYNVTVTYNGSTSAAFATQVVAAKPGLLTQDTTGTGLALVQNFISASQYDVNRLTTGTVPGYTISPAKPGQTLVAWGTGLGAVPFPDNSPPAGGYNYPNVKVLVGGSVITPAYAGVSQFPGLDQINFTLPANVATGCAVDLQIMVGSVTSMIATLSIAPNSSATACVYPGLTTQQLQQLDQGGTYTAGGFELVQLTGSIAGSGSQNQTLGLGGFTQVSGSELGALQASPAFLAGPSGACRVTPVMAIGSNPITAVGAVKLLDAGKISLNGPSGSNITNQNLTETANAYFSVLGGSIVPGTYALTGAGGKDVGNFQTSVASGSPLTITGGLPASVTESSTGLTLNWTGGNATDLVAIFGLSGVVTGTGASAVTNGTEFLCTTTAGVGAFTVPSSVLSQLPQVSAAALQAGTGVGLLEVISGPNPVTFTAPLTAGGAAPSTFGVFAGTSSIAAYQ